MITCRACLETKKEMKPLDEPFAIQYNLLTDLKISVGDKMSQLICSDCWETVNYFIEFRTRCITSESVMENAILNVFKDEPDINKLIECCDDSDIKHDCKIESVDSAVCDNIYDNNCFEIVETFEGPLSLTDVVAEDKANEPKRILIKRKIKEPTENKNVVKIKKPTKNVSNVKMALPIKIENKVKMKQTTKNENKVNMKQIKKAILKQQCGVCKASYEDKKELSAHLEGHKKDNMCQICHETFIEWPEILSHRFKHIPQSQKRCHLCNKHSFTHMSMEYHYRKMHYNGNNLKLRCTQCERSYETPRKLKKHIWGVHSNKEFICDYCDESFNTKLKIKTHLLKHTSYKSYACDICGYSSKYSSGLKEHKLRKHTAIKVYCKTCTRVFPNQQKRDQHICKQLSILCPVCGMEISRGARMSRHLQTHRNERPYKCDLCPAAYKNKKTLQAHRDKHDGNRTQQCEYCPAKFYYASVLLKHRRIHTGERPYVCKICQRSFTSNSNLKVHMQTHGEYLINKRVKPEIVSEC